MTIEAGELEWLVDLYSRAPNDDGFSTAEGDPAFAGQRWAKKTDVSDAERISASAQQQAITTRFLLRFDELTATIGSDWQIACEGVRYEVTGVKEARGRRVGVEVTAVAIRA